MQTQETIPPDGTWRLVQVDGRDLPINQGPLPTRDGGDSGCDAILTEGAIAFDSQRGRFSLYYNVRSSCHGHVLDTVDSKGSIEPADGGAALRGIGTSAEIREGRLVVQLFDQELVFADRQPPVEPVAGLFTMVPPTEPPIDPDGFCEIFLAAGTLELNPSDDLETDTGTFERNRHYRDSCTGEVVRSETGTGTYEQVDRLLDFVERISPNVISLYRADVRDGGLVLFAGGGNDVRFEP